MFFRLIILLSAISFLTACGGGGGGGVQPTTYPTVSLSTSTSSLAENSGTTVTLTVTASKTSTEDITVTLSTSGVAIDGTDYTTVNNTTITISSGSTTGTKSFTPTDDSTYEGDEVATIAISSVLGGGATESGDQSVSITITENELAPIVTISTPTSSINENSVSVITFTLALQIPAGGTQTTTSEDVVVQIGNSVSGYTATASASDYQLSSTSITIPSGSSTSTFTFSPVDDNIYEAEATSEVAYVAIDSVSGGSASFSSGDEWYAISIVENESPPTVSLGVNGGSSASVYDNGSNLTLTATSTLETTQDIVLTISTSGSDTATEGSDYATISDITIAAGQTTGTATFNPTPDTVNEGNETATVSITNVNGAGATASGTTSVTITINEYALRTGTAFTEGTAAEQNTIKGRSSWTTVDQSNNTVHPYELLNLHKVHSFSSGGTSLTGVGQTIYISDSALHTNHDSFTGKTITMLDTPSASTTKLTHGTHVASIAAGIVGEVTQGVAPDASLVFSDYHDNATDRASDLDTARTSHSAVAANHSWGYNDSCVGQTCYSSVTMTELEAAASAASRNVREQLSSQYWGGATPTSTYITALDNFQNSGVIVFANGNFSSDTDAAFMGALPYYFNGTDDSVDLSDAWISVMYAEFRGSSLTGASTSDFNRLGNPCGKAKEWCLVVDDKEIGAAGYVNSGGTSVWSIAGGSSMGAPQVSGGIALLAQAFPNHTPEQITDRLLASANNSWFTPEGNTTFTTHGNSITHGYHSEWGQGVPDFYAALSPITTNANPAMALYTGGSIQEGVSSGSSVSLASSSITPSSSFGDSIYQGLSGEVGYAYDALSGGFKYDMTTRIDMSNNDVPTISLASEMAKLDSLIAANNPSWKNSFSQVLSQLSKTDKLETSLTVGASSLPVQSFFGSNFDSSISLNDYETPYLESGEGGIGLGATYKLGNSRLLVGMTNPINQSSDNTIGLRKSLVASLEYGNADNAAITLMTGVTQDEDSLLGSTGNDAYSLSGSKSDTVFTAFKAQTQLSNNLSLTGVATLANTNMTKPDNSFVNSASNVKSTSVSLIVNKRDLFGDDSMSFFVSQPNRVSDGSLSIRLSNLADSDGSITYHNKDINLEPTARQLDYGMSYRKDFDKDISFSIKHMMTDNLNHKQDSQTVSSSFVGAKFKNLKVGFAIGDDENSKSAKMLYKFKF